MSRETAERQRARSAGVAVAKGRGDSRRLTTSERPTPVSWHASAMTVPSAIKWGARHGRRRRRGRPPTAGKKEGASAAVSVAGAEDAADRADTPANSPLSLGRRLRRPPSCVMSDVWSRSTTHAGWAWATSPCTGGHTDDRAPLDRHALFFFFCSLVAAFSQNLSPITRVSLCLTSSVSSAGRLPLAFRAASAMASCGACQAVGGGGFCGGGKQKQTLPCPNAGREDAQQTKLGVFGVDSAAPAPPSRLPSRLEGWAQPSSHGTLRGLRVWALKDALGGFFASSRVSRPPFFFSFEGGRRGRHSATFFRSNGRRHARHAAAGLTAHLTRLPAAA